MNRIFAALLVVCSSVPGLAADRGTQKAFEREMFAPSVLGSFGIDRKRLDSLNAKQREDLLSARRVLLRFLRAAQSHTPDVRRLVDSALLDRFPDQATMLQKLFGQETEVLIGAVTDFTLRSPNEIELGYYVVLFAEGRMLLRDDKTLLRRSRRDWVIARIGGLS